MKIKSIKKSIYTSIVPLGLILLSACSQDLLDENPRHLLTSQTLYKNLSGFESGLNGLYSLQRNGRLGENMLDFTSAGVDNMTNNYDGTALFRFWAGQNSPENTTLRGVFTSQYEIINAANTIINRADGEGIDWGAGAAAEANKNRVVADARAMRAWAYRNLTYGFGDVPLALTEATGAAIRTDWERAPVERVRRVIINDLKFAEQHLAVGGSLRGRITKGAVQHYLSEMYLTLNKPDSALIWADKVINSGAYKLVTSRYGKKASQPGNAFMDMFTMGNENREEGNTEALWVLQVEANVIGGGNSRMHNYHVGRYWDISIGGVRPLAKTTERGGGDDKARISLTKWAIDLYVPSDDRGSNFAIRKFFVLGDAAANAPWPADKLPAGYKYGDLIHMNWSNDITITTANRANWPWSRKAEGTNPSDINNQANVNDQVYLRLADTYLLKAEAEFKLGAPDKAATTINIIRARSKASAITAAQVNLDFILDERSRELVLEEERRFTLVRTGKWVERTKKYNNGGGAFVVARDALFPIPQVVIDANLTKQMPQNPGYN